MKTLLERCLFLGVFAALEAQPLQPGSKIYVFTYNYAGVPTEMLVRAEREASRIYGHAGLEIEWLDCPLTPEEAGRYPACETPVSPVRLAVRILSRGMAEKAGLPPAAFGSALFPEEGGFAMVAQVCWHCVLKLAEGRATMQGMILGHVMAHELGHLLLGMGSHGASGLMHVPWHKKELEKAAQGLLLFTPWEIARMRRQVLARIEISASARR